MASSRASNSQTAEQTILKRGSGDVGWDFGVLDDPTNLDKVRCILCKKVVSGGVHRLKLHIAGITGVVSACPSSSDVDKQKCKEALDTVKRKKKDKLKGQKEMLSEVCITEMDQEEDITQNAGIKRPRHLGPMDGFTSAINPEASMDSSKKTRQQNINDALFKQRTEDVHEYLARWVYEAGIPFHAVDNDVFKQLMEAVGQFGPGYRPPSQYLLREPLLKKEVERTKNSLKKQEEEWDKYGCSVMTDAWTDRKRRSIMNLCVNCKEGTCFMSSKEDSASAHTGQYIFEYVDKFIEELGAKRVIQVVTDNASNNMAAKDMLFKVRPQIFWTSCATHTMNLMLEGIGKTPKFKGLIEKAKSLTIFIYAHHKTLALMRKFTKKRDIIRPGVTRFATSFLTMQSLLDKKKQLRLMFSSDEWDDTKWSKQSKGKSAASTVLNSNFWNSIGLCLDVFAPLVRILRLVDGDKKPSMGFLYGGLKEAKEEIKKVLKNNKTSYGPILEIVDDKSQGRLDQPLHLAGYLLNPYFFYKDSNIGNDALVMKGMLSCIERFFPDDDEASNQLINVELLKYKGREGLFGKKFAIAGCEKDDEKYNPVGWWSNYGVETPLLQSMAMKILSLTTSSSGCERNWSHFEGIHTKKRNRLDATRLNNLVYVQFNSKIINKKKRAKVKNVDVLLSTEASKAQAWIVNGGDDEEIDPETGLPWELGEEAMGAAAAEEEPRRSARIAADLANSSRAVRELHEEEFVSDDETEDEVGDEEVDFESDDDTVVEKFGYGEEDD